MLLKNGVVLDSGTTDDVLTPENVRQLYGVDADVHRHESTGRLVVVPLGRAADGPRP